METILLVGNVLDPRHNFGIGVVEGVEGSIEFHRERHGRSHRHSDAAEPRNPLSILCRCWMRCSETPPAGMYGP